MYKFVLSGYFNPLGSHHIKMFNAAREIAGLAGEIIVIVNSDHQVSLKGSYPFQDEAERRLIVSSCKNVDDAIVAMDSDRSVARSLQYLKPFAFLNGGDVDCFEKLHPAEQEVCNRLGIMTFFGVGGNEKAGSSSKTLQRFVEYVTRPSPN